MATLDLNEQYKKTSSKLAAIQTYNETIQGRNQIIAQQQSNLEPAEDVSLSPLTNVTEQRKRYQREAESQIDKLLNLTRLIPDTTYTGKTFVDSRQIVRNTFVETLKTVESQIPQLLIDEMLRQLGCSQEQTYDTAVNNFAGGIYIPVESVDIFGYLKQKPDTPFGKLFYEKSKISIQKTPFSMNKELYKRIQNPGLSYKNEYGQNYVGQSLQSLFDLTYETQDQNGNQGNFFKVVLKNRKDNKNLVGQFITDYYKTVQIFDTKNVYLQLLNIIFGATSIQLNSGVGEIEDYSYFKRILARVLGLCFDEKTEIDVSGIAKVAPLDGIDDSFFELTDVDLRTIESEISNIKQGVFEYVDCSTIKQPFNTDEVFNILLQTLEVNNNDSAANEKILDETIQAIKNKTLGPTFSIGAKIDEDIIKKIPEAVYAAILSPKVLLPFFIMVKALESVQNNVNQSVLNEVYNLETFTKKYKVFTVQLMSKIGALFVKTLRDIIVRDLRKNLRTLTRELQASQRNKRAAIITYLIEGVVLLTQFTTDYRQCKSVIDDIFNIIEYALRGVGAPIPPFLLRLSSLRQGFSKERAFLEVIQLSQKLGIPTGPLPDGSPNLYMLSVKAMIDGVEIERDQNGKIEFMTPETAVTPIGTTISMPGSGIPL